MPEVPTASPIKGRRGIRAQGDQLVGEDNRRLHALSLQTALEELCAFLEQSSNNVLVGHNIQTFDRSFLFRALESCSLLERFCGLVDGEHRKICFLAFYCPAMSGAEYTGKLCYITYRLLVLFH